VKRDIETEIKEALTRHHAMFEIMDGKKSTNQRERTMNREQLLMAIVFYASLTCAFLFSALTTLFAWVTRGCEIAETYFETLTEKYRR